MIELATSSRSGVNAFTSGQTLTFTGLPASPAEHRVVARIEFAHVDDGDTTRTLRVQAVNAVNDQVYKEFYVEISNRDAGEFDHFEVGPLTIDASDGMSVIITSDRDGDDNVNIVGFLFSDDVDYYLAFRAAEASPTALSLTARIKSILADIRGGLGYSLFVANTQGGMTDEQVEISSLDPVYRDTAATTLAFEDGIIFFLTGNVAGEQQRVETFTGAGNGTYIIIPGGAFSAAPSEGATGLLIPAASVGDMGANTITSSAIQANAIGASEIADNAIDAGALATSAITKIQDGLATTAKLLAYVQLLARSDAAITSDNATELSEINADEGSGAGDYAATTESQEAILDTLTARTLVAASYFNASEDTVANVTTVGSVTTKTGYSLLSSGLDLVTAWTVNITGNLSGSVGSVTTKTGYSLTVGERNSIAAAHLDLANGVETGVTVRQAMQRIGAVVAGKISGAGGGTEVFVGLDNSTDRVTVTVDSSGNRTAISYV